MHTLDCTLMRRVYLSSGLYGASGERKYLNADERRRFIAASRLAEPEVRTFCLILTYTGCRISEALQLMGRDIQVSGVVSIRCLKKRGRLVVREVPVPAFVAAEVARVHARGRGRADGQSLLWPWGRTRGWQTVKDIMVAARIQHLAASPRGLRHSFGVHAVCSGVPLNLVQKWLGHEDIATTSIYTNVLGPEERGIAARMW